MRITLCRSILLFIFCFLSPFLFPQKLFEIYKKRNLSKFTSYLERNPNIINDTNYEGATVLHVSTRNNSPNFIKVYLDLGADINAKDRHGTTALMYAERNGNLSDLNLLLSGRANLNRKDKQGKNVLFY